MSFEIRKFSAIPKIVGRGAKPGVVKPPLYNFADLKEPGDGFNFPLVLAKKVRGAIQAYRANYPQYKFAVRPDPDFPNTFVDGVNQNDGLGACILSEILSDTQVAALKAERAATERATAAALNGGTGRVSNGSGNSVGVALPGAVMASSVDDALEGLSI